MFDHQRRTFRAVAATGPRLSVVSPLTASAATFTLALATPVLVGAAGSTLVVDIGTTLRPVSHVGSGGLYALRDGSTPAASPWVDLLHLNQIVQPPPGAQQLPNGSPVPVGNVLVVDPTAVSVGAHVTVRMPDIYPNFPYKWLSWNDWLGRVSTMVNAVLQANAKGKTNIDGWELWNEPDSTWDTTNAGTYLAGWTRTYQAVRALDPNTPIVGPSYSHWDATAMQSFLTNAQTTKSIPEVICWHELSGWSHVTGDVQSYRALETQLGIAPRPISIDEYADTSEVDVPSAANHYVAQFERTGVRDGERAFWYESGTINGLLYKGSPTGTYWMYRWYGDQSGNVVSVTPTTSNDGVATYDASVRTMVLVFGGEAGTNYVTVKGVDAIGPTVTVTLNHTTATGRMTNLMAPTMLSTTDEAVQGGEVTVTVPDQETQGAYELIVTGRGKDIPGNVADAAGGGSAEASADGSSGAETVDARASSAEGSGSPSSASSGAGTSAESSGPSASGPSPSGRGPVGNDAGCGCAAAGLTPDSGEWAGAFAALASVLAVGRGCRWRRLAGDRSSFSSFRTFVQSRLARPRPRNA